MLEDDEKTIRRLLFLYLQRAKESPDGAHPMPVDDVTPPLHRSTVSQSLAGFSQLPKIRPTSRELVRALESSAGREARLSFTFIG